MSKSKSKKAINQKRQAWGILFLGISLLLFLAIVTFNVNDPSSLSVSSQGVKVRNWLGPFGSWISYILMQWTLGYPIVVLPLLLFLYSLNVIRKDTISGLKRIVWTLIAWALLLSIVLALPEAVRTAGHMQEYYPSGLIGGWLASKMVVYLGRFGSMALIAIITLTLAVISLRMEVNQFVQFWITAWNGLTTATKHFFKNIGEKQALKKELKANKKAEKLKEQVPLGREADRPGVAEKSVPTERKPEINIDEVKESSASVTAVNKEQKEQIVPSEPQAVQTSLDDILSSLKELDEKKEKGTGFEVEDQVQNKELDYDQLVKESVAKYKFPSIDLLHSPPANQVRVTREELTANAEILELKLRDYGVEAKVVKVTAGPVITLYELQPAPGVKVSAIVSLSKELAMAMEAKGIRIIAPIPGTAAVGIEIPNRHPQMVYLKSLIRSERFMKAGLNLPLAMGKAINGEVYVHDLTSMPHLLIAGTTGSGKSVGINTIIMSLLYAVDPGKVKFMMVDPKKLELSLYRELRDHYLLWRPDLDEEVITKPSNAVTMLNSIVLEMEKRYEQLSELGARNIIEFNKRISEGRNSRNGKKFQLLPYIIVVVDELADLMMIAAKEIEGPIARLAQMARAVGIHLIVATQRPSVDVITGIIKANFPARIAYKVFSKVDSRTVIDMNGAEQLLGNGDMLFLPPGQPKPIRLQNPFISTEEVEAVINHIRRQPKLPNYSIPQPSSSRGSGFDRGGDNTRDPLYKEARAIVVQHQQGSISFLQRRLQIGYSRAARLMDQLEEDGVVGPPDGSKAREVRITLQELQNLP